LWNKQAVDTDGDGIHPGIPDEARDEIEICRYYSWMASGRNVNGQVPGVRSRQQTKHNLEVVIWGERQVKQVNPDLKVRPDRADVDSQDVRGGSWGSIQRVEQAQIGNSPGWMGRSRYAGNHWQETNNPQEKKQTVHFVFDLQEAGGRRIRLKLWIILHGQCIGNQAQSSTCRRGETDEIRLTSAEQDGCAHPATSQATPT
jgi:hypothetical protein